MFDDQMIAHRIKRIGIKAGKVRLGQAFVQLEIENLKP